MRERERDRGCRQPLAFRVRHLLLLLSVVMEAIHAMHAQGGRDQGRRRRECWVSGRGESLSLLTTSTASASSAPRRMAAWMRET